MNWISYFLTMDEQSRARRRFSTLQFFIPLHTKKRYSPRARVYRGMPLAGGRNTAASNIGNIDRQTSFRAVRRLDNSPRKCRGNGEGLIKKYLQPSIITRRTCRVLTHARAGERGREKRNKGQEMERRPWDLVRSAIRLQCRVSSFFLPLLPVLFSSFFIFFSSECPIDRRPLVELRVRAP